MLRQEPNYYRIQQNLSGDTEGPIEIQLLIRICDYLMQREHDDKALPNFIAAIADDADESTGKQLRQFLYSNEEQCARVLSRALNRRFPRSLIEDRALNERYETAVQAWCPDHPFLTDTHFRNAVFAAAAVARCALSDFQEFRELALEYAESHHPTYHLMYLMEVLTKDRKIDARCFNMLMQSCSDFLGTTAAISVEITGESWEETEPDEKASADLEMTIEFPEKQQERSFSFVGRSHDASVITFGPSLINAKITLPGQIKLLGRPALEAIGECSISARSVLIETTDLVVRSIARRSGHKQVEAGLFIDAQRLEGHADAISGGDGLQILYCDHGLDYPLAKFAHQVAEPVLDPDLREKYLRLRRILMQFRSHKKGGLAKYRDKVENERVIKDDLGRAVLALLLDEGVLTYDVKFYYIDSDRLAAKLGVAWHELRQHKSSQELNNFLGRVK